MRLFIAINLSDAMKGSLINTQNALYDLGVRGNYTSEENLHLTLASIKGNVIFIFIAGCRCAVA